jgi:hypothetical protein
VNGITANEVCAEAMGCICGWIGWTEPRDDSPQRRIRILDEGDSHVDVLVEGARYTDEPDRAFRIALAVTEVAV